MNLLLILGIALLLGGALGWIYFQVLWAATRQLSRRPHPGAWFVLSLLARLALVLAGFTLVVRWGGWPALAAALAGFLIARTVLVRRARAPAHPAEDQP